MDDSDANEQQDYTITLSPGGQNNLYTPLCDIQFKPRVGQKFVSLDDAIDYYRKYALMCGFDIRLGSATWSEDGQILTWKYIYCNREGFNNPKPDTDSLEKKRRRISKRVGCMARVAFKYNGLEGYVTDKFIEDHTHELIPEDYKYMMKMNTKLTDGHQTVLIGCAKANIPPMKGFRFLKEFAGSHANVGCSKSQMKNFSRDLKAFVLGSDAQILIDKMQKNREMCEGFYFDYEVDENHHLKSLFWADSISRRDSCAFGDAVSFDATYGTNTYAMIFAPFNGKDNHGRNVTLGAALLTGESHISYEWAFKQFIKSMGREPLILMTDQDPAILKAFDNVFKKARHRLCMWHIMMKLPIRVAEVKTNDLFMKDFCNLVWSSDLEPHVFEETWKEVIESFELSENTWLSSMYAIRDKWIPAYFRETNMGGIFRTTSPSESTNNFFQMHMSEHSNLLQFFMHFESALDTQRHTQAKLNNEDLSGCCVLRTKLAFEKHISSLYTSSILSKVQDEIENACYLCRHRNTTVSESACLYTFEDKLNNGIIKVTYEILEKNMHCTCQKFVMTGHICSHMFYVFKDQDFVQIPPKFIVTRWTKKALTNMSHTLDDVVVKSAANIEKQRLVAFDIISTFYKCLGLTEGDESKQMLLFNVLKDTEDKLNACNEKMSTLKGKNKLFEEYYSASIPAEVVIKPPLQVTTKGSGSGVEARKAAAIVKQNKPPRKCSICGVIGSHDARNCPTKKK